jgi:ABC-type antimicrobial peptide transport system permease subunit
LPGLIAGMAGASLSAGATVSLLFGVTPHDPISLAIVAVALTTAAAVASYVPARRAGHVDPIVALRADNG